MATTQKPTTEKPKVSKVEVIVRDREKGNSRSLTVYKATIDEVYAKIKKLFSK